MVEGWQRKVIAVRVRFKVTFCLESIVLLYEKYVTFAKKQAPLYYRHT